MAKQSRVVVQAEKEKERERDDENLHLLKNYFCVTVCWLALAWLVGANPKSLSI